MDLNALLCMIYELDSRVLTLSVVFRAGHLHGIIDAVLH